MGPTPGGSKRGLRQSPGDCFSDPPVGTCLVPTAETIVGVRVLHTPCEEREGAEGIVESGFPYAGLFVLSAGLYGIAPDYVKDVFRRREENENF
jgi:hypothetical protein